MKEAVTREGGSRSVGCVQVVQLSTHVCGRSSWNGGGESSIHRIRRHSEASMAVNDMIMRECISSGTVLGTHIRNTYRKLYTIFVQCF
jgi:hypothetical protein